MVLAKEKLPIQFGGCNIIGRCYRCEYSNICADGEVTRNCAGKMASNLPGLELFKLDTYDQNYSAMGVELHCYLLGEEKDLTANVYVPKRELGGGHLSKSWALLRKNQKLRPLITKLPRKDKFHLRGSESYCDIGRIISKTGHDLLIERYNLKINDKLSKIGVFRHALCNQQNSDDFQQNYTWERLGCEPTTRNKYCEILTEYETRDGIKVRGHADVALTFGEDCVGVADFKRGRYESKDKKRQILTYACGFNQMLGNSYAWAFGILILRPFTEFQGQYLLPKHKVHITKNHPDSEPIRDWIDAEWLRTYQEQAKLLHDREYFLRCKEEQYSKTGCRNITTGEDCFQKPFCDLFARLLEKDHRSLIDFIDDEKIALKDWLPPQA